MAIEVTLAQFNKIASGKYNAGFIDFKSNAAGKAISELRKVNNHVHSTSDNKETLSPKRVLEIKEAFIAAMERAQVSQESIAHIREDLGIPKELEATGDQTSLCSLLTARFKPLTRQQVRDILDNYANGGKGFTDASKAAVSAKDARAAQKTKNMSDSRRKTREQIDRANINAAFGGGDIDYSLTDVMSILSTSRSFASLSTARKNRVKGEGKDADELRDTKVRNLGSGLATLFAVALKMLPAGVHESEEFFFLGTPVKLVKGDDGKLSAVVGMDECKTTLKLGIDAEVLVGRLATRSAQEPKAIGGGAVVKEMLNAAYATDIANGLMASDRTSLTRNFAARILEAHGKEMLADDEEAMIRLERGNYNTGLLVQIAQRSLDGELTGDNVINTKQTLDNYYAKMRKDTANLPDDIKEILEGVANMPIEPVDDGEFIVRAQLVGDIDAQINAIHPVPQPQLPQDITLTDIKDFVADIIFSNDTMVSDVVINQPGEMMRRTLSDPRKLAVFTSIIKNLDVLDSITSEAVAAVLKAGFAELKDKLDAAFKAANHGTSIDQAKAQPDFDVRFAEFFRDAQKLSGEVLAEFDIALDNMANSACVKIQEFINEVFGIHAGGVIAVKDPYSTMSKDDIKTELDGKSLNKILDEAATSEVPGQVGFFKQVVSTYFTHLEQSDKRSCLAAALRYSNVFNFAGKQGEELQSAEAAALNKFTGAILKGAGPLLHKMMQGLPKDIMGKYADALEDMKQHLAPMPRKIVQAYLNKMIADSNGKIQSIKLVKSLGAASVGEAFLCEVNVVKKEQLTREVSLEEMLENGGQQFVPVFDGSGKPVMVESVETQEVVIKIMRHDAERRMEKEAQIFTAAAEKIPGMAKTWEGQLKQYRKEFDFRNEAKNVQEGVKLYGISNYEPPEGEDDEEVGGRHPLHAIGKDVATMKLSNLAEPSKNIMVAEVVDGSTVDEFFKNSISEIRNKAGTVFEQDTATGRIKWEDKLDVDTQKTVKKPVFRKNFKPSEAVSTLSFLHTANQKLTEASNKLMQATKVWFYNAIIGDGKFHGDAHSGNLMISSGQIGFIDFGNLYELQKQRADGVNEQQELMRVIIGAAFRDKAIFLKGFEKLMSAEGKALLKNPNKPDEKTDVLVKAEAILDSVLSTQHGSFSFNIVYRLQAAIVELQKLGLELPSQINCFIQSLVRLSNSITEINTIINQTRAMMDSLVNLDIPAPQDRDSLDYVGRLFDAFASKDGRKRVRARKENNSYELVAPDANKNPTDVLLPGYIQLMRSADFGGDGKGLVANNFEKNGSYSKRVAQRLKDAQDPIAEATKLANDFAKHFPPGSEQTRKVNEQLRQFSALIRESATADDPANAKEVAIKIFANNFAETQGKAIKDMKNSFETDIYLRKGGDKKPPTFASAITDILFDYFDDVKNSVGEDGFRIYQDARGIVKSELNRNVGFFDSDGVIEAIQEDARNEGGDNSYKIDIGV